MAELDEYRSDIEPVGEVESKKIDPENPVDVKRLSRAVRYSYKKLKKFRENMYDFVRESVGNHYSDSGTTHAVPVNLLQLWKSIYARKLIASNPRVLVTTDKRKLKPFCGLFEEAMNHFIRHINLKGKMQKIVADSLFSIGIAKVGLAAGNVYEFENSTIDIGNIFVENINLDNFIMDMCATDFDYCQFIGDITKVDAEIAKELWGKNKSFKYLSGQVDQVYGLAERNDKKLAVLSRGRNTEQDGEYKKLVNIANIWLPNEKLIVTIPWDEKGNEYDEALEIKDYYGHERGPYALLKYNEVPGNIMPFSPAAQVYDLHCSINKIYRKLIRQSERQKDLLAVDPSAKKEVENLKNSADGDIFMMKFPDRAKEMSYGGPNNNNLAFFLNATNLFNKISGNIDSLGGLASSADTYGQDKLLAGTVSEQLAEMQDRVEDFTRDICERVGWYLFYDPFIELPMSKRLPGINIDIPVTFSEENMEGDFLDYNFSIKPFSLIEDTPTMKFNNLISVFNNLIMPLQPMFQQQGISFDARKFVEIISKFKNLNELNEILIMMETGEMAGGDKQPIGQMPQKTTREYIRRNVSGTSDNSKDSALMQSLLTGIGEGQAKSGKAAIFQ